MDAVREDMAVVEVTEKDAEGRTKCRWKICCGDPRRDKEKEEELFPYNSYCGQPYQPKNADESADRIEVIIRPNVACVTDRKLRAPYKP